MNLRDAPRELEGPGDVWGGEAYVHEIGLGGLVDRSIHGSGGAGGVFDIACVLSNMIFDDLEENGWRPAVRKRGKRMRLQNRVQRVHPLARHYHR